MDYGSFLQGSIHLPGQGKCPSSDLDAQIADSTITMTQHMLLTVRYRVDNYEAMNGLFSEISGLAIQQRLNQRIWGLFAELLQLIATVFDQVDEQDLPERIFQNPRANELIARLLGHTEQKNKAAYRKWKTTTLENTGNQKTPETWIRSLCAKL